MFMDLYKRCFTKITKRISIHSFVAELTAKYRKLRVRRELTAEQKREIQDYYKSLTGHRVPLIWHKFLYSRRNEYSKKYIPLSLYRTELIGRMNQYWMMDAYADKNVSDMLFPDVTQPTTFIKNINGYYYAGNKAITKEEAERICSNLAGVRVTDNVDDCDILFGIKEADIRTLIPEKHYFFFGHIAKMQAYNRPLLQTLMAKRITFSDYEYLVDDDNRRVCAFGWWAGIVGTYYTLRGYGLRHHLYELPKPDKHFTLEALTNALIPMQ